MTKVYILTHKHCHDGFGAAWVANHFFSQYPDCEVHHVYINPSNVDFSQIVDPDEILSFDVAYTYQDYQVLMGMCEKVLILDHHISMYEELKDKEPTGYFYDNDRSGCILAWDYFYQDRQPPKTLLYIQDRDIWTYTMPDSKDVTTGLYNILRVGDFDQWTDFIINEEERLQECLVLGRTLNSIRDRRLYSLKRNSAVKIIDGLNVAVVNATEHISDLGNYLCQDPNVDYAFIWRANHETGEIYVSLRSIKEEADVSVIAKSFGGGGHTHASGFSVYDIFDIWHYLSIDE